MQASTEGEAGKSILDSTMAGGIVHYNDRLFLSKDGTQTCQEVGEFVLIYSSLLHFIIQYTDSIRDGDYYSYVVASLTSDYPVDPFPSRGPAIGSFGPQVEARLVDVYAVLRHTLLVHPVCIYFSGRFYLEKVR